MTALQLLGDLQERGVVFERRNDRLRIDAPESVLTEEVERELVKHKTELLELIDGTRTLRRIDDPITAMPLDEFATAGKILVVHSEALKRRVLFVSDNVPEHQIGDHDLPVYRASELKKLALLKPSRSMLRTINEAKSVFRDLGATIEEVEHEH